MTLMANRSPVLLITALKVVHLTYFGHALLVSCLMNDQYIKCLPLRTSHLLIWSIHCSFVVKCGPKHHAEWESTWSLQM